MRVFKEERAEKKLTLSGIVSEVKPLQPENAYSPMLVTLPGITTIVSAFFKRHFLSTPFSIVKSMFSLLINSFFLCFPGDQFRYLMKKLLSTRIPLLKQYASAKDPVGVWTTTLASF